MLTLLLSLIVWIATPQGYSVLPCNAFDNANPVMGNVLYMFYLSKLLDFMDTFFIIVGKKWNQLSLLHVYHHLTIFFVRRHRLLSSARARVAAQ